MAQCKKCGKLLVKGSSFTIGKNGEYSFNFCCFDHMVQHLRDPTKDMELYYTDSNYRLIEDFESQERMVCWEFWPMDRSEVNFLRKE